MKFRCERDVLVEALGLVVALLGTTVACADQPTAPRSQLRLEITPETASHAAGDIVHVTAVLVDEDGSAVPVGAVDLTTDQPSVATVHAASRLRAVSPGRTILRGAASGAVDSVEIEVLATPAEFALERFEGDELPVTVAADSVDWNGEPEYHEVIVASGAFRLVGGSQPRYELIIHYQEYDVRYFGGERVASLRLQWNEYDRGTVAYDGGGGLDMTSEIFAPLHHRSASVSGGFVVDFRIPGTDERLDMFYRR